MNETKILTFGLATFLLAGLGWGLYSFLSPAVCDPKTAETQLAAMTEKGIQRVSHPPSQSNLLWVHVTPTWKALSEDDKRSLDRLVRCAARTIDEQGHPTWQAAYYDAESGTLVALSSRKWGFRLKEQESHFAQDFAVP